METYQEQKRRHAAEFNAFDGIFFAFSNEQMKEGIEKHGVNESNRVVNIGAGGFVLKSRLQEFKDLLKRQENERHALKQDIKEMTEALIYELQNHEYCVTGDPTAALESLDLTVDTIDKDILKNAIRQHNERMANV